MRDKRIIPIDNDNIYEKFEEHIKHAYNERIIFSGRYGTGKTHFLNNFFEESEKYFSLFISPINYSTNTTTDVFQLIKVDVLISLLIKNELDIDEGFKAESFSEVMSMYVSKPDSILKNILDTYSMVSNSFEIDGVENIATMAKVILSLKDKFEKYKEKINTELISEESKVNIFLEDFLTRPGSPYEQDFVTQFINTSLEVVSEGKESVLVIDDIDRLDPEHVFRILNILSVHHNSLGSNNKFIFDKVILVFDIDNVKNMFYHRYGERVDFDGYIDKFYSSEVFKFSIENSLNEFLYSDFFAPLGKENGLTFLRLLLLALLDNKLINIRQIIKLRLLEDHFVKKIILSSEKIETPRRQIGGYIFNEKTTVVLNSMDVSLFFIVKCLLLLLGSKDRLLEALDVLYNDHARNNEKLSPHIIREVLSVLIVPVHLNRINQVDKNFFTHISHNENRPLLGDIHGVKYEIRFDASFSPEFECHMANNFNIDVRPTKGFKDIDFRKIIELLKITLTSSKMKEYLKKIESW